MTTLLAGACSGCQTFGNGKAGMANVRGQSPEWAMTEPAKAEEGVTPAGHYHTPIRSAASGIHDHYVEHHSQSVHHGRVAPQDGAAGPGCPPEGYGNGYGNCPPGDGGYGNCPPGDGGYGSCPPGGNSCRQDRYTYNYLVPNNLVYPQQNAVGGAVVYPYYTHRGPSDFFRQ